MTVSSNGTPTLAAASASASMSVTGTWGSGQSRTAGHLLVAAVTCYGTTTAQLGPPPSGWRLDRSVTANSQTTTAFFTKTAAGSDAAPALTAATTGTAGDSSLQVVLFDFSDSGGGTPVAAAAGAATGTSGALTVTTAQNVLASGSLGVLAGIASRGTTAATTTWTTPSGWTLAADQTGSARSQMASYTTSSAPSTGSTLSAALTHSRTSTEQSGLIFVVSPPGSITGTTYYVSPSGSNSNAGTSSGSPWQTVAKVNGSTFNPGDSVLFQGGQTFSAQLVPPSEGTSDLPVTFGSYGTGQATISVTAEPAIYALNVGGLTVENLTLSGTAPSGDYNGGAHFESGDNGQRAAVTASNVTASGFQWGAAAIADTNWSGFGTVTISGCTLNGNTYAGAFTNAQGAAAVYTFGQVTVENCTCNDNTGQTGGVTDASGFGIFVNGAGGSTISGNTCADNGASNPNTSTGVCGILVSCSNNVTVSSNLIYGQSGNAADGDGIDLDVYCLNCTVEYNLIYGCTSAGILLFASGGAWSGNVCRFNVLWGNCQGAYGSFGEISVFGTPASTGIYNNTVIGNGGGTSASGAFFCDNSVSSPTGLTAWNNIFYSAVQQVVYTDTAFATTALDMQGNLYYYSGGTAHINWAGTTYTTLASWQSATGQEKYSGSGTGLLTNPLVNAAGTGPTVTTAPAITTYTSARLASGSPCAGAGLNLESDFSINPGTQDFWGDPLSVPLPIGADMGPVAVSRPRPFVARKAAPARAVCGPRSASSAGVASPVVTPLGSPSQPPARPVIVHLPPHRAKVGPGTYLAAGRPGVQTPLGFQAQPAPRPVIVHVPPHRAHLGPRGLAAGGVPSAVVTPLGSPSQPAPRPVIQHLPPRRAVWRGFASRVVTPPPPVTTGLSSLFGGEHVGGPGGGLVSFVVTPLGSPPSPAPRPVIQHAPPRRAVWRGYASPASIPLGILGRPRPFVFRSPLPARARLGSSGMLAAGRTGVQTPLGSLQAPRKAQVAPPRTSRARAGASQVAGGHAVAVVTAPVTAYQRPAPQIRRPVPARAWTGRGIASQTVTPLGYPAAPAPRPVIQHLPPRRAVWRGYASAVVTPLGTPSRPAPFVFRSPAPARTRLGSASRAAGGVASQTVTPLGYPAAPAPRPVIQHLPPHRGIGKGLASAVVTPLGTVGPPRPFVARKGGFRAIAGHSPVAAGLASQVSTPLGTVSPPRPLMFRRPVPARVLWRGLAVSPATTAVTAYQRPPVQVRRPARPRALWRGYASPVVTPLGSLGPPRPFVARSPLPPRPRGLWRGLAVALPPLGTTVAQRPAPYIKRPAPARAVTGPRAMLAAGRTGVQTPLGSLGPPHPFVFRSPLPVRTRGLWRGYAAVLAPMGVTAAQRPAPQIRRPAPARGKLGPSGRAAAGIASPVVTPLGSLPAPRKVPLFPPKITRARVGHGTVGGGIFSFNLIPAPQAYQRPAPHVKRPGPARAVTGHGGPAGGYASPVSTPLGSLPQPAPRPVIQHLPPHRAVWHGAAVAAAAVTTAYQRKSFIFRSPLPVRARLGSRVTCGGGITPAAVMPGAAGPPRPFVARSPLPPRARGLWRGYAVPPVPVPVRQQRPAPQVRRPAPARARLGPSGQAAAGAASQVVTPLGSAAPPRPFVFRSPAPARARLGTRATASGGVASRVSTPLGTAVPPKPFVFRPPAPARGKTGPRGSASGGLASRIVTPLGAVGPPRPFVARSPVPVRARGLWRGRTGIQTPLGSVGPPHPFVFRSPLPARARGLWRGYASSAVTLPPGPWPLFAAPAAQWKWAAGGAQPTWGTDGDQWKWAAGGARNQ